jgi:hypothetical protein
MQTQSSYRLIKWALFAGLGASVATACVVSEGDGNVDGTDFGGEAIAGGEPNNTSGKGGKGGSSAAGTGTAGGEGGSGATTAEAGTGAGGEGDGYVPGQCESEAPIPSAPLSCDPLPSDDAEGRECLKCLKAKCCDTWQTCYGEEPTTACGYGETAAANGQIDCIFACYFENNDGITPEGDVLNACGDECTNQCADLNQVTNDLLDCARNGETEMAGDDCMAECFPPPAD